MTNPTPNILILMADQLGKSVGDMYKGAFIPGFMLMGLYVLWVVILAIFKPKMVPALPVEARVFSILQDRGEESLDLLVGHVGEADARRGLRRGGAPPAQDHRDQTGGGDHLCQPGRAAGSAGYFRTDPAHEKVTGNPEKRD